MRIDDFSQKQQNMIIGLLMLVVSILFLIYIGNSLRQSNKRFLQQFSLEVVDDFTIDEEV